MQDDDRIAINRLTPKDAADFHIFAEPVQGLGSERFHHITVEVNAGLTIRMLPGRVIIRPIDWPGLA